MTVPNGSVSTPLAIIGMGCLFPKAANARAFWLNIKHGVDAIGPVPPTHWKPEDYFDRDPKSPDRTYAARGGFLDAVDFRPLDFGIAPNDLEATDTAQLLGLVAAREALLDAGYGPDRAVDRNRISVILGVTGTLELVIPLGARLGHPRWREALKKAGVPEAKAEEIIRGISDSYVNWQENSFPGLLGNVVAGRIANRLDLGGTNCVVDAACASSLSAIHLAGLELAAGRSDLVVTGGVDTFNDIFMYMCFSKTPALSPTGDAKPFDAHGDGTILGEGLGLVVLKRLADAERDGDRVYAVIKGLGSSSDGKGNAIYAPSSAGQMKALRETYRLAGVSPDTIELVEGHGTGTKVGDAAEVDALTEVYREARKDGVWCALGSVKSQIGHTKAAAGSAGLIKAALALHHQVLPPTLKVREPIAALKNSPFYVNTERRPWLPNPDHPRRAAVSAFGFGGSNFHCVLEEHGSSKPAIDWEDDVEIIALSAPTHAALSTALAPWAKSLSWSEVRESAAVSRAQFRESAALRLSLVIQRDSTDLPKLVAAVRAKLAAEPEAKFWRLPEGAYFGAGSAFGKLAVLFPGQGSQYVGMLRDLACQFPEMRSVLADGNRVFARISTNSERLSDVVYPPTPFSKEDRERNELRLRDTQIAQPAIGAVSLGALKVLETFGVKPDAYAGHSYGELPALCAAGCFDAEALHTLSRLRGHLMASFHHGDAGSMLAVHASPTVLAPILEEESLELVLANRNSPQQCVLSGRTAEIERAVTTLDRRKVRSTRLPVAAAFHSPLVASAREPFRAAMGSVVFQRSQRPVFANTTGEPYPTDVEEIRSLLTEQLARPVDFIREIEGMAAEGVRTFLEVGPGSTLTKLVSAILTENDRAAPGWDAFAADASSGRRSGSLDLAHVLARLAARGHTVDLTPWQHSDSPRRSVVESSKGFSVPICGANYRSPRPTPPSTTQVSSSTTTAPKILTKPVTQPMVSRIEPASEHPSQHTNGKPQPSAPPEALSQALLVTQQSMAAFQKLQEQTAQLHRQFLENQEAAQRTLQMLVEQQQTLIRGGGSVQPVALPRSVAPPPPVKRDPEPAAKPSRNGHHAPPSPPPKPAPVIQAPEPVRTPPVQIKQRSATADRGAILMAIVAEKTGYPADMLSPEMALDADLGIDSIKRVEIFSALQEKLPDAPVVKPEHLGSLHTLQDVLAFLGETTQPTVTIESASQLVSQLDPKPILFAVVAEKTGYPAEMLSPEMALDADLGIDSIKRVEIFSALQERLPDAPIVKPEHLGSLHTLADVVAFLSPAVVTTVIEPAQKKNSEPVTEPSSTDLIERLALRAVPLQASKRTRLKLAPSAMIWVVAEDSPSTAALVQAIESGDCMVRRFSWSDDPLQVLESTCAGVLLIAPSQTQIDDLPLRAFRWIKRASKPLRETSHTGTALFGTLTALDGSFGLLNGGGSFSAETGALAGLLKTAKHEWPEVNCKAIDIDPAFPSSRVAEVWAEWLCKGPLEVGISTDSIIELKLEVGTTSTDQPAGLTREDIVVVTGGARGVTAAAALAIAERFQPTIVLLGRSSIEETEPEYLRDCTTEAAIKQALARHLPSPATPRAIEAEFRRLSARREVRGTLDTLRATGARAHYFAVDVTDATAVAKVMAQVRSVTGPITCLIHGAGVLADRRMEDLNDDAFAKVYATKVTGWQNLCQAIGNDPLKALVLFSSSTGRFGRTGQAAYAAANEGLNKIAQHWARQHPSCKTVAINWGPWDGGMVTPALRTLFAAEGVGVIPLREGGEVLVRELSAPRGDVEVTIIARPPLTPEPASPLSLAFEQQLNLREHPILASHILDGKAVLPLALHIEWLAHAALHGNPGLVFHGFNNLRILNGVQLDPELNIRVLAGKASKHDGFFLIPVEMQGERAGKKVVYSRTEMVLATRLPTAPLPTVIPSKGTYSHLLDQAYREFLFHGSDLQGLTQVHGVDKHGIVVDSRSAPHSSKWFQRPLRSAWIADPLVLDGAFQAMILWSFQQHGSGCLPCFVGSYRQYRKAFPSDSTRIVCGIHASGSLARANIDFIDPSGALIARIEDHESVIDANLNRAFRRNQVKERAALEGSGAR